MGYEIREQRVFLVFQDCTLVGEIKKNTGIGGLRYEFIRQTHGEHIKFDTLVAVVDKLSSLRDNDTRQGVIQSTDYKTKLT